MPIKEIDNQGKLAKTHNNEKIVITRLILGTGLSGLVDLNTFGLV